MESKQYSGLLENTHIYIYRPLILYWMINAYGDETTDMGNIPLEKLC